VQTPRRKPAQAGGALCPLNIKEQKQSIVKPKHKATHRFLQKPGVKT
jgi:hypothetical protein